MKISPSSPAAVVLSMNVCLNADIHADIHWVKDSMGTLISNPSRKIYWVFTGLEADIWDWLVLGHPFDEIIEFSAYFLELPHMEAKARVFALLQKWVDAGILKMEEH
jgi:hypothetical protein